MYCSLIYQSVTDPISSRFTSKTSRRPYVMQRFCLHPKHWLLNNTYLNIYRVFAWHFVFDPAASHTIYQTAAKHKICIHQPQSHILRANSDEIPDMIPGEYIIFRAAFPALLHTLQGGPIRTRFTVPNRLSPVSMSCNSVS